MNKYSYNGPVRVNGNLVADHWKGETMAVSENKARNNLAYQYKKSHNLIASVKVTLSGNITIIS